MKPRILSRMIYCVFVLAVCYQHLASASRCQKMSSLAALEDHNTVVETSLRLLAGTWHSDSCETRPGPEFVLRSYTFDIDGNYHLIQHHYRDDSCSSPKLTVISHGKIFLRSSLVQPGASTGFTKVTNISLIPQDDIAVKELDEIVALECPGQYWKTWRRYEERVIFDSTKHDGKKRTHNLWVPVHRSSNNHRMINANINNIHTTDVACLGSIKWAFNELKLLKVQLRPIMDNFRRRPKEVKMELLFGDIHSTTKLRHLYSPTSFQVPLLKQVKDETVTVQKHSYVVKNPSTIPVNIFTNSKTPPHLIEKPHLPPYIWGEWTSVRCETRPMGLYLTRRFSFYSQDQTWIGEHKFYSDPFCMVPKFVVTAAGRFTLMGPSIVIKGTTDIDFQIEKASLTVMDQRMIYDMRLPGVCGEGEWEVNVPKELSTTNGCVQLGIILPSVQYDIVKLEMDYKGACLLFLGQVETDSLHSASVSVERPTAFQVPLVKCGEHPQYSQSLREILGTNVYYNSGRNVQTFYYLIVMTVTCVMHFS